MDFDIARLSNSRGGVVAYTGRVDVLQSHPRVAPSNPVLQACGRCNSDVQALHIMPVFPGGVMGGANPLDDPEAFGAMDDSAGDETYFHGGRRSAGSATRATQAFDR